MSVFKSRFLLLAPQILPLQVLPLAAASARRDTVLSTDCTGGSDVGNGEGLSFGQPVEVKLSVKQTPALAPGTLAVVSKLFKMVSRGYHFSCKHPVGRHVLDSTGRNGHTLEGHHGREQRCEKWKESEKEERLFHTSDHDTRHRRCLANRR